MRSRTTRWAITVILLLAIACPLGASTATAAHHSAKIPQRCKQNLKSKGTIKFSDWQFPDTLNPAQSGLLVTFYIVNAMFDGLFVYNDKGRLIPQMTTKLPTVKNGGLRDGGKTVVLHLKKGLRWSNGVEITSADIKFGLAVGQSPESGPICTGSCDVIARIDTPNKYTAVMHLKRPYAPILAYGIPPIFPRKWAGSWNNDATTAAKVIYQDNTFNYESPNYPTNGAYQVQEFVKDDRVVMRPLKYYNDMTCGSRLKNLIFSFYSSKQGLIAAAANGDTDITGGGGGYTPADLPELRKNSGYKLYQTPSFTLEHLEFNVDAQYDGKPNPLSNVKVRLALALALDKIGLIKSALGVNTKAAQDIAAWTPLVSTPELRQPFTDRTITGQWDPLTKKYTAATGTGKALADAQKLLSQTPYKDGFDLHLATTTGNPVRVAQAGVIQNNWKRLGVNVTVDYIPASTIFGEWDDNGTLHRGQFLVGMFGSSGSPDPDQLKYNMVSRYIDRSQQTHVPINQNYSGIRNSKIDKAFAEAAKTLSNKHRAKNYHLIQQETVKNAYWIGLYYRPSIATSSNHIKGFLNNPTHAGPTWNIYDWTVSS